jgi:hypothetical protein
MRVRLTTRPPDDELAMARDHGREWPTHGFEPG